jgi:hypothetical protein
VDPNDIRLETRDDGSLKVLGAGTYGKVRAARCAGSIKALLNLTLCCHPRAACRGAAHPGAARAQWGRAGSMLPPASGLPLRRSPQRRQGARGFAPACS